MTLSHLVRATLLSAVIGTAAAGTEVSFSAQAEQSVPRDNLSLQFSIQENGTRRSQLTQNVTERVNRVIQAARRAGFEPELASRNSWQGNNGQWNENARIIVRSDRITELNRLAANLAPYASVDGAQYTVSAAAAERYNDALLRNALSGFKKRATLIAEQLGGSGYEIIQLNIGNTNNQNYRPIMYATMRAAAPEAMDEAAGNGTVSLSLDGKIRILGQH